MKTKQTQMLTGFLFHLIFIYFSAVSKAMTCLCFKLIDSKYWFILILLLQRNNVHLFMFETCPKAKSQKINKQTNNTFNCWKSIKPFERITLKFYIVMKLAIHTAHNSHANFQRTRKRKTIKNCCQSSHKKYILLKTITMRRVELTELKKEEKNIIALQYKVVI